MYFVKNLTLILIVFFLFSFLFIYPIDITNTINKSISIWIIKIVPSLIPTIILLLLIIKLNIGYTLGKIFYPINKFLFNSENDVASFVIVCSIISGAPTSSKLVSTAYENGHISSKYRDYILNYFSFISPIYIYYTVGILIFNNYTIANVLLITNISTGLFMAIFNKPKKLNYSNVEVIKTKVDFLDTLFDVLDETMKVILTVLSFMIFFSIISLILTKLNLIPNFLIGLIDIASGVENINSNLSININISITASLLSFLSLSIQMQLYKFNKGFNIIKFIFIRVIHAIFSFITCYIILLYFYNFS